MFERSLIRASESCFTPYSLIDFTSEAGIGAADGFAYKKF